MARIYNVQPKTPKPVVGQPVNTPQGLLGKIEKVIARLASGDYLVTVRYDTPLGKRGDAFPLALVDYFQSELVAI